MAAYHPFNSSKCDYLPPLDRYFELYFSLQKLAIDEMSFKFPNHKYLYDRCSVNPS